MRKHLPQILLIFVFLLLIMLIISVVSGRSGGNASAFTGRDGYLFAEPGYVVGSYGDFGDVVTPVSVSPVEERFRIYPDISVNGISISRNAEITFVEDTIYVAAASVISALLPLAELEQLQEGSVVFRDTDFRCEMRSSDPYFQINEQYFYVPTEIREGMHGPMVPLTTLAQALRCTVRQDSFTGHIAVRHVCPIPKTFVYNENDLYWLSHIIFAESGNQSMPGRVAVGTVIMNRLHNSAFPNTIEEIIFQKGQFSPVDNGSIYLEPDAWSVIAAKLCLSGVREAGDSLYFNVSSMQSWASFHRPYVCTIGGHSFFL